MSGRRALFVGLGVLAASQATAQPPQPDSNRRSPQEEKRRQLLEEVGLEKQKPAPAAPTTAPSTPDADARPGAGPEEASPRAPGGNKASGPAGPSFRRAIHPMLMSTCAGCHRAGAMARATRLVLSGDAAADHATVARLVSLREPSASPLLVKVSGQPHAGGSPWLPESAAYGRLLAWIANGARLDGTERTPAAPPAPPPVALPAAPGAPPPLPPARDRSTASTAAEAPASPAAAPDPFAPVHQILMSACASCHRQGAAAGTTRLLLSGDAADDERAARALVDPVAPDQSLLLTKAGGAMHGGGAVLPASDPRSAALAAWARSPAAGPAASQPAPADVAVGGAAPPVVVAPAPAPPPPAHQPGGGLELPAGFLLNGRFDLDYERRNFTGHAFGSEGVNALRSYHHFLFLSRARAGEPCGLSAEIIALTFWEAHCRLLARATPVALVVAGGKILVPFGADPLYHQSYGGLAGFDQRILPAIWAQEGVAAHLVHHRGDLVFSDDLFVVRGYGLPRADSVINLQSDFSPADATHLGWGNRLGVSWRGISAWYSGYYNPLGFQRHLFMQAIDVTVYRQRDIPVLGLFTFGAGLLRADVAGGDDAGVGGVGKDYYHFGSYFQVRYHPTDWLYLQYRQGLRTFDNRRGVILDNSRLTSADGSTHNFGVVGRYRGLSAGVYYFVNLEKVDEIPDDLFRVNVTYEF